MNPNVPAGAAILLDFIYRTETSKGPPDCYEVIFGHNQDKLPKPITSMTLDEVEAAQPGWTKRFGSSAAGAAQFMRNTLDAPKTLRDIEGEMGLTGKERFSPDLQDLMAFHLLKRRGYVEFMAGTLPLRAFGNNLAKEWASFPVLTNIKGAHRAVKRGQSYYAGDGQNKALTSPASVEAVLTKALTALPKPAPRPEPSTGPAAFPVKGAKRDETVAQVQRRLKELGYSEIGNVDGDFGDLTEKAIIIFRHDAGLPLGGTIDSSLLVALIKAKPREMPAARAEATAKEVREVVPEAKANWFSKVVGFFATITGAIWAFISWAIGSFADIRAFVQPLLDMLADVPVWVYALAVTGGALWLYLNGRKGEQASVEAVQEGARR